jgi:2'-hydroxyisoflavone reductase
MRILIIGGTVFLGRHLTEAALTAGHEVTQFNRGTREVEFSGPVEHLRGDRTGDLAPLAGRDWDAVFDTSGYAPSVVRRSAQALAGRAGTYVFISSESVYDLAGRDGFDESTPVKPLPDGTGEEVTGETYGPLKALCEQEVEGAFPGAAVLIRPGMIVGPNDPTDRFTYWPNRAGRNGRVLAPGRPDRPVQLIDVRDLAGWIVSLVERRVAGTFNAAGPEQPLTMAGMLAACGIPDPVWVDEGFLLEQGVEPWSELPFWLPENDEDAALFDGDVARQVGSGLTFRPLVDTVRDLMAWHARRGTEIGSPTLAPQREAELLAAYAGS